MEHIEEAGVHSGDSACAIPPYSLPGPVVARDPRSHASRWPASCSVIGLMNMQFAVKTRRRASTIVYVLEVNPRASRTVPFVSKATGHAGGQDRGQGDGRRDAGRAGHHRRPDSGARLGQGERVPVQQVRRRRHRARPGDAIDRRSDGHQRAVLDRVRQEPARRRHRAAATRATIFISVADRHKEHVVELARRLAALGFKLLATDGTADALEAAGIPVQRVKKLAGRPPEPARLPDRRRRRSWSSTRPAAKAPAPTKAASAPPPCKRRALHHHDPSGDAAVKAMEALREEEMKVQALQDRFAPGA